MISIRIQKIILMILWFSGGLILFTKGAGNLGAISENRALHIFLLIVGYLLGELKARNILMRSALRDPLPKDFLLIALMMGMGVILAQLSMPAEARGLLQVAIGYALIRGAVFRSRRFVEGSRALETK
jgi:hypothetical protein